MGTVESHRDLTVWQKSMDLVVRVYDMTKAFPREELYGLTSQMRRCAVSIPSNIAEGRRRGTKKDYIHFLQMSFGSGAELETQIEIAERIGYIDSARRDQVLTLLTEVMKMLNKMIHQMV